MTTTSSEPPRTDDLGRNNGPVEFADQLYQARKAAGLSIPTAATRVGVSPRTWSYWEAGTRTPPDEASAITRERVLLRVTRDQG